MVSVTLSVLADASAVECHLCVPLVCPSIVRNLRKFPIQVQSRRPCRRRGSTTCRSGCKAGLLLTSSVCPTLRPTIAISFRHLFLLYTLNFLQRTQCHDGCTAIRTVSRYGEHWNTRPIEATIIPHKLRKCSVRVPSNEGPMWKSTKSTTGRKRTAN